MMIYIVLYAKDCYENSHWLYCDLCFQKISGHTKVYHCDRKKPQHENAPMVSVTLNQPRLDLRKYFKGDIFNSVWVIILIS